MLVSVVIPYFEGAATLRETIMSVSAQAMAACEIILVDDCSPTAPPALPAGLDLPVTVLRMPANLGAGAARNVGLRAARGRYVCFLDQDDLYAPDFFRMAVACLETHPDIAGVATGITLIDCHRPVSDIHRAQMAEVLPGNMMIRSAAARLIGGFPEAAAFRGMSAGEDSAFRAALTDNFLIARLAEPYFHFRVRRNASFDFFMDRTEIIDGRLVFRIKTDQERDGSQEQAQRAYVAAARERVREIRALAAPMAAPSSLTPFFLANRRFESLRATLGGATDPEEGFALYQWGVDGSGHGAALQIGIESPWLAAACRDSGRGTLLRAEWGDHPVPPVPAIRFLLMGGDPLPSVAKQTLDRWLRLVENCGAFALLGVGRSSGITSLHTDILQHNRAVIEACRINSLSVFGPR